MSNDLLYSDIIKDNKETRKHLTNIMYICFGVIALLVGAIFTLNVFTQNKIERMAKEHTAQYQEFISQFEFETIAEDIDIDQDLQSQDAMFNSGNVTIPK